MIENDFSGNFMQGETEPGAAPPWLVAVLGAGVDPTPLAPDPATLARGLRALACAGGRWHVRQPASRPLTPGERAAIASWLDAIGEGDGLARARVMARAELDATARDAALTLARARGGVGGS